MLDWGRYWAVQHSMDLVLVGPGALGLIGPEHHYSSAAGGLGLGSVLAILLGHCATR